MLNAALKLDNPFRPHRLDVVALASAPSRIDLWTQAINTADVSAMAEVGVWKGAFSKAILQRCASVGRFFMIDPWASLPDWDKPLNVEQTRFDEVYDEAMRATDFAAARRTVLRGRTKDVASEIPDGSLDFVYIDGDHTLRGIAIDLQRMLPKVRAGGFIGGDDFSPTPWQHDARYEPTLVFPYAVFFAEAMDLPIFALPHDQFLIRNAADQGFSFTDLTARYGDLSMRELQPPPTVARLMRRAVRRLGI
ncbi:MAG: class I SAM-dependent methyltransferase [Parvularculaceae bacterium]|nr:class I SAM-dependent methyltransferase [Parvularculaceae bacterium]